jgi:DNA-binding LytR/AlgR family response regulator
MVKACFYVRDRGRFWKIENEEVVFIEAQKSYCRIRTREKVWMVMGQISAFESALPSEDFVRIHRSFLIGWRYLQSFDHRMVYLPGHQLPIGESYRGSMEQRLLIIQPGMLTLRLDKPALHNGKESKRHIEERFI